MEKVIPETDSLLHLEQEIVSCDLCPRLVRWREKVALEKRAMYLDHSYWGKPVPGFGDPNAVLWLIGLAPAAHGGNRTGRVFTGDRSGDFLYRALHDTGWARLEKVWGRDDGQELFGAYLSAAVRCAPPENKPTPEEFRNCRPFLLREKRQLTNVRAVLVLGAVALREWIQMMREVDPGSFRKMPPFAHGTEVIYPDPHPRLFVSYHPSQRNTQTGLLTLPMMTGVLGRIRDALGEDLVRNVPVGDRKGE
ncbi:MAG: uracil-DNA glycosylase [Leptospirales bacterium]